VSKASILRNWGFAKEAKQKERSVVYYRDAIFAHDERIQQAIEILSFEPIPINSLFHKEKE
jgi:hypothetical protein